MATVTPRTDKKTGRKYWQLDYTPKGGARVRTSLGPVNTMSRAEAKLTARSKDYEVRTGKPVFVPAPLFEAFRTEYLAWRAKKFPRSQERVEGILNAEHMEVFVGRPLSDPLLPGLIDNWQVSRLQCVANNTMLKEFRQLHALFRKAIKWRRGITDNPCGEAEKPKERKRKPRVAYSSAEAALLYAQPLHGLKWKLMCNTGLRRMEALKAEVSWFNLTRRELTIRSEEDEDEDEDEKPVARVKPRGRRAKPDQGWEPKSGHYRVVPLNDAAIAAFKALMKGREDQRYVLPRIAKQSLSRAFVRDAKRCGLGGSLHSTRHTYGMHLAEAGVPLPTIQRLMGHANISTTMIYAVTSQEHAMRLALKVAV